MRTREEKLTLLRDAVVRLKDGPWPKYWRVAASRLVAKELALSESGINGFISTLTPEEWASLELPEPVNQDRPEPVPVNAPVVEKRKACVRRRNERRVAMLPLIPMALHSMKESGTLISQRNLAKKLASMLGRPWQSVLNVLRYDLTFADYADLRAQHEDLHLQLDRASGTRKGNRVVTVRQPRKPRQLLQDAVDEFRENSEWIVRSYKEAIDRLAPELRTRAHLAIALDENPAVVDWFLTQHPDIANQLKDGHVVVRKPEPALAP